MSVQGGDQETVAIVEMLVDDGHELYFISKSDTPKAKEQGSDFFNEEQLSRMHDIHIESDRMKELLDNDEVFDYDKEYKDLDAVIILNGQIPNNAYPIGYNPHGLKTLQCYERYVFAPLKVYERYCQHWKKGSCYILVDDRYRPQLYDYCNPWDMRVPPKRILSQANT
jgi:hypothetical protein